MSIYDNNESIEIKYVRLNHHHHNHKRQDKV